MGNAVPGSCAIEDKSTEAEQHVRVHQYLGVIKVLDLSSVEKGPLVGCLIFGDEIYPIIWGL